MNTNNLNTSNNSSIVAEYEESLLKEILATVEIAGMSVVIRDHSIIINEAKKGQAISFHKYAESRGALTALIDGFHIKKYPVLQIGLHMVYSFETLRKFARKDMVGYLTYMYDGDNKQLLKLRPASGVAVLSWQGGNFAVKETVLDAPKNNYDESDTVTRLRAVYWKHTAMDAILSGEKLNVSPWLKQNVADADGEKHLEYSEARVEGFLKEYAISLTVSPEEAGRRAYQAGLKKIYRRDEGRANAAINSAQVALPTTTILNIDGKDVEIKDLMGKTLIKKRGSIAFGTVEVTESNAASLITNQAQFKTKYELA